MFCHYKKHLQSINFHKLPNATSYYRSIIMGLLYYKLFCHFKFLVTAEKKN